MKLFSKKCKRISLSFCRRYAIQYCILNSKSALQTDSVAERPPKLGKESDTIEMLTHFATGFDSTGSPAGRE